ncbi:FAD-binding protein [Streptomyces vinaceus]|uniref:FAD-binding protein n=1 Tax=Streptomyces vinaceus TaxID=1960 RepID=UPI0035DED68B
MDMHTAEASLDRTAWAPGQVGNWAGNVSFCATSVHRPTSMEELGAVVAGHDRVKVVGRGYSFSTVADTAGALVRLDGMPKVVEVDAGRRQVRVAAGTTFTELGPYLHRQGFALPNLGSLPHVSVAGACATGTHGSGRGNPSIAAGVREVELVISDGKPIRLDRSSPGFGGSVTSLGALGIATHLTLDLVPAYDVEQYVWEGLGWPELVRDFDAITDCAYSVSVFTDWGGRHTVWVKRRVQDPLPDLSSTGAYPADGPRHPVAGMTVESCNAQQGAAGPWWERLPHLRADRLPGAGGELHSEYFVPLDRAREALEAVRGLRDVIGPVLRGSELRTQASEETWLSPGHGRDSLAIHFTWRADADGVGRVIPALELALAPFAPRPHWGGLFAMKPEQLAASYPRWEDFQALRAALDPAGVFRNAFTTRHFG